MFYKICLINNSGVSILVGEVPKKEGGFFTTIDIQSKPSMKLTIRKEAN